MSSGVDLRVSRSVDLLVALKQTVADFAKKEETLTRELLNRRGTANRRHRETMEKTDAKLAAQIEETEARFKSEEVRVNAIYTKRRTRIDQLGAVATRSLPRRAEEAKGRWMGDLQMRRFHAERSRTADLKAADADAADFAKRLSEQQGLLGNLEKHARKFFGGYGALLRMLRETPAAGAAAGELPEMFAAMRTQIASADAQLAAFRKLAIPRCFSDVPLVVLMLLIVVAGGVLGIVLGGNQKAFAIAGGVVVALLALVVVIHRMGFQQAKPAAAGIASMKPKSSAPPTTRTSTSSAKWACRSSHASPKNTDRPPST